jgi:hypothetical protein
MASPQWKCFGVVIHDNEWITAGPEDPETAVCKKHTRQGKNKFTLCKLFWFGQSFLLINGTLLNRVARIRPIGID